MLDTIRQQIASHLEAEGISVELKGLTDTQLLMRVVMKRCIYGVDINVLSVELSKVSLWLHTFTVGAPLSFLDHHLRNGNSLLGVMMRDLIGWLRETLMGEEFARLLNAAVVIREVSESADATVEDVDRSKKLFREYEKDALVYNRLLDLWISQWWGVGPAYEFVTVFGKTALEWVGLEAFEIRRILDVEKISDQDRKYYEGILESYGLRAQKPFFHWDIEFPEVFIDLKRRDWLKNPGFDVVIGNPPYDELSPSALGKKIDEDKFIEASKVYNDAGSNRVNLYRLFIARAWQIICKGGTNSFIVPMYLLGDRYTRELRRMLLRSANFQLVDAFPQKDDPNRRVFPDAKLPTCLYVFDKSEPWGPFRVAVHEGREILPESRFIKVTTEEIERFDHENLPIPMLSQGEWELAKRLGAADFLQWLF